MPRILIVDDELEALELLGSWLKAQQYDVISAHDGESAIALAEVQQPDLILLDVIMPGLDGIETCKRLRSNPLTQRIPVLLLTARTPPAGRLDGLLAGADDFLPKPIDLAELVTRIESLLGGSSTFIDQGQRLIDEVVQGAIPVLASSLAWVLELDTRQQMLVNRAIATARGSWAAEAFLRSLSQGDEVVSYPLSEARHPLINTILTGEADYNMPLSVLRASGDQDLYRACTNLDLYFVTLIPLQTGRIPLGVLMVGTLEPVDVETTRGRQLVNTVASQAASVVNNSRLTTLLAEREAQSNRERAFRQTLLDTMGDGLLVHDSQGQIRFVNKRLIFMTGYSETRLHTMHVEELFHPDERGRVAQLVRQEGGPEKSLSLELRLQNASGRAISVLMAQAPRPVSSTSQGNEYVVVLTDLSESRAREEALSRQVHHITALSRASQIVTSTFELDHILQSILNEALHVLNAKTAFVAMKAPREPDLVIQASTGENASLLKQQTIDSSGELVSYIVDAGKSLLASGEEAHLETDELIGAATLSLLAVPLVIQEDISGLLAVTDSEADRFDNKDLELLQSLAHTASLAIENARLYSSSQQHIRELTLLLRASEATAAAFDIEEVMENIAVQLVETLGVQYCVIAARSEGELRRVAEVADLYHEDEGAVRIRLGEHDLAREALQSGEIQVFSPDNDDTATSAQMQTLAETGVSKLLAVPIMRRGTVVGVVELYDIARSRALTEADIAGVQMAVSTWSEKLTGDWHAPPNVRELSRMLREASGIGWCTVLNYEGEEPRIIYDAGHAVWSTRNSPAIQLEDDGIYHAALRDSIPFHFDLHDPDLSEADRILLPRLGAGVALAAPLMARGEANGLVILIDTDQDRSYSMTELSLTQAIANMTGHALDNANLFTELTQRASQLEQAYNHLRQADRIKDEVIQNVSHELRTPLTLIMGYAELMVEGDLGPMTDSQIEAIETINQKSLQLAKLVDDILTVRMVESEKLRRSPLLLSEAAEVALRSMEANAARRDVQILSRFEGNHHLVNVNKSRMIQVFENLLSNAIKFSPPGSEVEIVIEDGADSVEARIIDHGIGIPKEEQDKIWWRFYQVDGSTTRQFGGTGLGLAIVKSVVEQHSGEVWVESEIGQGSTFGLVLPRHTLSYQKE